MKERACRRVPVRIGCWLVEVDGAACLYTFDLSERGVCLVSDEPLPVGKVVRLHFFTPQGATPVEATAEVVWSTEEADRSLMGLCFLETSELVQATIREFTALLRQQRF